MIVSYLGFQGVLAFNFYLGLSTKVGRSKQIPFGFIKDKVAKQLSSWMDSLTSWSDREVFIKVVA